MSISFVEHRVNYSETDQMGFVYHANYLVWLDMARTEHLRGTGVTYKDMEERGVFLAVTEARIRYRQAARYDDLVRIRCWVRDLASRRVVFGYAVERAGTGELLATAETALIALDRQRALSRVPADVTERLHAIPDPVRL
ncbi:MAG TPA: thioesterase family protein [Gemmatimonadales bacterium]|nr:thioesterase family protein [Gemmatimonadales bacterium]